MPLSIIFLATAGVTKVPFVAMTMRKPLFVPYEAISKMSGLSSGSPPVKIITGDDIAAISSISFKHFSVDSSPG
jgi:hypothetical protein